MTGVGFPTHWKKVAEDGRGQNASGCNFAPDAAHESEPG